MKKIKYAPSLESVDSLNIKKKYDLFIGGKFKSALSKKYMSSINPATGKEICKISKASKSDVNSAVNAADKAYKSWSKLSGAQRGKYLFRIARIIQERAKEFALFETLDGGKPIKESKNADVPLAANYFFYYAGWADKLEYLVPGKEVKPVGVCGQIIPWNFPLLMAAWKIAPALAAGNTVVIKPAETTSLTALLLAEVFIEAELPAGVVNIVTGEGDTGEFIVSHTKVKKVAFTGSTAIGKHISKLIAGSDKKLTLELGGKSANIVYADAAIDQAVEGVVKGIFYNQGHICSAGSRLLIEESIEEEFIKKLKKRMNKIIVGNPLDKNTDMGAINSKKQWAKINKLVKDGKKEGGTFWESSSCKDKSSGLFMAPCFFRGQSQTSTLSREEVFGPVLQILTFRNPDEAIKKANDSRYGLAAGIWSEKSSKIHYTASKLKAGVIWSNTYNRFDPTSPFGGFKESGFGREGGLHGLLPYVEVK